MGCLLYPLVCFFLRRNSSIDAAKKVDLRLRVRRNVRPVILGKLRFLVMQVQQMEVSSLGFGDRLLHHHYHQKPHEHDLLLDPQRATKGSDSI